MMKPSEWLDKIKDKEHLTSDYQLAKLIGIKGNGLANLRKRDNGMDNYTAIRIAEILEINKIEVIIDMELQKAKTKEKQDFWRKKQEVYL